MLHIRHVIFVALIAIGAGRLALRAGTVPSAHATSHSSTAHSNSSHSSTRQRQERAWRAWYNRYRRELRPGYYYPDGYPPGYTGDNTPTTSPSGGENNGVVGVAPGVAQPGLFNNNAAANTPATPEASTPQAVDPEVLAAVARVKKACMERLDYQTALSEKKGAEDHLSTLRQDGLDIDPAVAMPLAKIALDAGLRMSAIELEETTKDAQNAGLPPKKQPADAAAK
jgi:hypothetical protein